MSAYDSVNKIWSSNGRTSIYNPKTSVGEIILYALNRTPDKICEISDDYGSFLTCQEVRNRSIFVAENLKKVHGVKFGDICAIVSKNNPEVSSIAFGCLYLGAPLNTMDPTFDQNDFDHMIGLTKPKFIFTDISVLDKIRKSLERLKLNSKIFTFSTLDGTTAEGLESVVTLFDAKNITVDLRDYLPVRIPDTAKHIALIVCSSGTTGLSKGVCLPHAQVVSQVFRFNSIDSNDIAFVFSSLYWVSGIMTLLMGTVEGAIRITTCKPFTPNYFFGLVERHKISHTFMPPSLIAQCLESKELSKADLSSLKRCYTGGSLILEELRAEFEKYLGGGGVLCCYGMTEVSTSVVINFTRKPGSVGVIINEHKMKILSEEGEPLGPGEKGEICIHQPYAFLGYYGNEEEFKHVQDSEGWIHSGDLGYFDEEGYLFIVGRIKEMIKYKNHQIAPGSIETIIQENTGLTQVCAVAIEDHRHGTDLPAVLIVRPSDFHMTESEIVNVLDTCLTDIKKLRGGIYFVENLPMTPSAKILRRLAKKLANKLYFESKGKEK